MTLLYVIISVAFFHHGALSTPMTTITIKHALVLETPRELAKKMGEVHTLSRSVVKPSQTKERQQKQQEVLHFTPRDLRLISLNYIQEDNLFSKILMPQMMPLLLSSTNSRPPCPYLYTISFLWLVVSISLKRPFLKTTKTKNWCV